MKISASIYSGNGSDLPALVRELDEYQIDYYHVDSLDDTAVFEDIKLIKSLSETPVDLHVISPEPDRFSPYIADTGVDAVTFQYEESSELPELPDETDVGLAIVSETPVEVFADYQDRCSFVLFMTTTPGRSGGEFDRETFRRIRRFKRLFPDARVHVDGGVNAEVSFILRNMGVYAAVTGSYLLKAEFIGARLLNLHREGISSHHRVRDFMIEAGELPALESEQLSLGSVLHSIEAFKLGFTVVTDGRRRLEGLITNADVRRGLLRHIGALDDVDPASLVNRDPLVIEQDATIAELLERINTVPFPVLFLPVVDDDRRLVGAVTFNNLIKGEA